MNFVGHVVAASWEDDDPRYGVGAMLPDLARMSGAATPTASDAAIARGIACHHRVDAAFHDVATFVALVASARAGLRDAGVGVACRRAAAHVGVELLLDGVLLRDSEGARAFTDAALAARALAPASLAWREAAPPSRFEELVHALPVIADGYASAATVADRIVRILARRPRLSADAREAEAIRAWVHTTAPRVQDAADRVLDELRTALGVVR